MRLAPVVITLFLLAWSFLAAIAWALVTVRARNEPRLLTLGIGVIVGVLAAVAPPLFGWRDGVALLLSFPLAFFTSLLVSAVLDRARLDRRKETRD